MPFADGLLTVDRVRLPLMGPIQAINCVRPLFGGVYTSLGLHITFKDTIVAKLIAKHE